MIGTKTFMKIPWGIIAAAGMMFCSFATVAVVVLYRVDIALTIEGSEGVSVFATWYQTLLLVSDILIFSAAVAAIVFYFIKRSRTAVSDMRNISVHGQAVTENPADVSEQYEHEREEAVLRRERRRAECEKNSAAEDGEDNV